MTSNLGSNLIQEMAGEDQYDAMKAAVMETVGQHFRPEFINRVDDVVVFHPLEQGQIRAIADIQLAHLRERLAERDLRLELSEAALNMISAEGFDPVYGARPLKRVIQHDIENPLAQSILSGQFNAGDTIAVDVENDSLTFKTLTLH
jgi:ATP-dependent Clp protease ATP-binding subunit ClpB